MEHPVGRLSFALRSPGAAADEVSRQTVRTTAYYLNVRRSNHRAFAGGLKGSWLLVAADGPAYPITVRGDTVESRPAEGSGALFSGAFPGP